MLRRTLEETDRTAIVQFSLRQKTRLGALRSRGKVLMLQSLLWDDEVREADFKVLDKDVRVSPQELKMSGSLVSNMETEFKPDKFSDDYQEQLRTLIDAKIKDGDALDTAATFGEESDDEDKGGDVVDLMEALRQSVERNRSGRSSAASGSSGGSPTGAEKSAAKKSSAKKSSAKKSSAKKATDGKSADKKPAKKATAKSNVKKAS